MSETQQAVHVKERMDQMQLTRTAFLNDVDGFMMHFARAASQLRRKCAVIQKVETLHPIEGSLQGVLTAHFTWCGDLQ